MIPAFLPVKVYRKIREISMFLALLFVSSQLRPLASAPHPTLTSARVAHGLTAEEASRHYPIRIQAVVTYYDPSPNPRHSVLFIADSSASIYAALIATPTPPIKIGDLVEVTGKSGPGEYAPVIDYAQARRISAAQLPSSAPGVSMASMLAGEVDAQWVEIQGVVHAVHADGRHVYFDLAVRDGDITAMMVQTNQADFSSLVDATVAIRGNEGTVFNNQRQLTGAHLLFPGIDALRVLKPAPSAPFDQPVQPLAGLLHFSPSSGLSHRVHVQGTVTLHWPGRMLCVENDGHGLCAQTDQADPLARGDRVNLLGFPALGAFTPTLLHAQYKPLNLQAAVPPVPVTVDQALTGAQDSRLVSIQARLIGHDESASDPTIALSAGDSILSAVLPRKYLAQSLLLPEGSVVKVTGICSTQADGSHRDSTSGFPVPTSIRILLQSPADVAVLHKPSWWNASHTLRVLALALLVALTGLSRATILAQRVKRQSHTIRDSEARFRHLATHDALTELPNRASVLQSLEIAAGIARQTGGSVCVALIDLDHFKHINDTFGHVAGDEVLRQAARRLASAVRSTDVIGRYGGEEFLIVFNDMELENGIGRCELVRQALCDRPIRWNDQDLAITCSIGVAAARMVQGPVPVLVSRADDAMYAAKSQGRNRVVSASSLIAADLACFAGGM